MPDTDIQVSKQYRAYTKINGVLFLIGVLQIQGDTSYLEKGLGFMLEELAPPGVVPRMFTKYIFTGIFRSDYLNTDFLIFEDEPSKPIPSTS